MSATLSSGLVALGSAALSLADTVTAIAANITFILSAFGLL
ncbi:hypothetical protein [Nocardia acididurans]|nr:hypothetical protein [Nocardia acididurans]